MDVKVLISILLLVICSAEAFQSLIPEGKELVFEYEGIISASTHIPRPYASSFSLHGNLLVQKDGEDVFVKFSGLEYKMFNGLDDDYDSKILPIPEQVGDFSKAFRIKYQPSGIVEGISIGKDEAEYVLNFKKSISSLLQMDLETLEKNDNDDVYVFQTVESTIYGKGLVDYTVNIDKDTYHVDIRQPTDFTRRMYAHFYSNTEYESRMSDFDEPLNLDSQRSYVLKKVGNNKIIDSIKHHGGIYNTPFNAKGEAHVIYVNQTLELKSIKPITSKINCESEVYNDNLIYHVADLDHSFDITNGRRSVSKDAMVDKAITLIKDLIDYVADTQINATRPDFNKGQILNKLSTVMLTFDEKLFDEMFDKLHETNDLLQLNIYKQMLSELGTHAAYRHIIKLFNEKKTTDQSFAYNMFSNVMFPNKKLVEDMAQILKWDHNPIINGVATLSFATLLSKAVERNKRYKSLNPEFRPDSKLEEEYPNAKYYEKYIIAFVNKLKEAKTYKEQIIYLQALHNTRMESVVQHLLPAIKGEWWKDYHLRIMSALSITPMVIRDAELTFKIFWPFMVNSKIPTSFRIIAYNTIMKSKPNLAIITKIYWFMHSIKNHDLYTFHYQYIKAISESENPHDRKFIVHLRQILKYTLKPVSRGLTGYYHLDYYNEEYSFGEEMNLEVIHSKYENDLVLSGSYKKTVNRLTEKPYWVFIRISGFKESFLKALKLDSKSKTLLFTWENLMNVVMNMGKSDDVKVTFIVASNGNTILAQVYDKNNVAYFLDTFKSLITTIDKMEDGGINLSHELAEAIVIPTDMGFPVLCYNYVPDIDYTHLLMTREDGDGQIKIFFSIYFKSLTNSRRGLSFYNPVLDVFQGVSKLHSLDQAFSLSFNTSIDTVQRTFKISWERGDSLNGEFFVERTYTETIVYVHDDLKTDVLQKSSSNCKNYEVVTLGEEYKTNYTVKILPEFPTIPHFKEFVFDLEEPLPKKIKSNVELFSKDYFKSFIYSVRFEELQPKEIHYGLVRTLKINEFMPVDKVDMTIKLETEYTKGGNYLYPAVTYKMKLHFHTETKDHQLRDWTANAKFDMDDGHMNNVFSFQSTKGENNPTFCIKGDSVWSKSEPKFKSEIYISYNSAEGELCVKNNSLISIEIQGEKSEEQMERQYSYHSCHEDVKDLIDNQKSLECLFEYDSLRKYTISLKHYFPYNKGDILQSLIGEVAPKLSSDSNPIFPIDGVESNEVRIIADFPMRPSNSYKFQVYYYKNFGTSYEVSEGVESGVYAISGSVFEFMHDLGLTEICLINYPKNTCTNINGVDHVYTPSKDWTVFLAMIQIEPKFRIWMKSADGNDMVLKFEFGDHNLIIEPKDGAYIFTMDGSEMKNNSWTNEWMYYVLIKDTKLVSVYIKNIGVHVIYNGHQASIEYPQIDGVKMDGYCVYEGHPTE